MMSNNIDWLKSVYSDGSKWFVSNPLPKKGEKITIALQVSEDSPVKAVVLRTKLNGVERLFKMKKITDKNILATNTANGLSRYETSIQVFEKELRYQFYLTTEDCIYYYTENGITTYIPNEAYDFRILTDYQQPTWVKNAVFYQIFPERFCNGNPDNDVKDNEYVFDGYPVKKVKDWNSVPEEYEKAHCLDFYGGDLEGITQKIPYLKKLGITAIYLNPIFYGATVHKYDCLDYFHVDPHFGGDEAFEELCKELHKNDIKIILDVSINHTGIACKWFNRDGTFFPKSQGAFNNPDSEEREFYFFGKDNSYKSWFNVTTLPTLNYTSEKLRNRLYRDSDSLVKKWLKPPYSTDGWRFDVADTMARNDELQLHHEVWPEIRKSIKEENSQAYILAEDWSDCTDFLNGDEWDSPMNYIGSSRPIRQFFGETDILNTRLPELNSVKYKMTAKDFSGRISSILNRLPFAIRQVQFNLLGSHDLPRMHNNPKISKDAYKGAVIMMFTLPGSANIYYGDEAEIDGTSPAMEGCRYPMPWDKDIESTDAYKMYSTLTKIKTTSPAFADGGFKFLWDEDYVVAFARFTPKDLFITVASSDTEDREIKLPIYIFGKDFSKNIPKTDVFGNKLETSVDSGFLKVKIPAGKSYLIDLSIK